MDIFIGEPFANDRLDCFGFGDFLGNEPAAIQHVQKIGVAAGIELVSPLHFNAALAEKVDNRAMENSRAHLRFDVVADDR